MNDKETEMIEERFGMLRKIMQRIRRRRENAHRLQKNGKLPPVPTSNIPSKKNEETKRRERDMSLRKFERKQTMNIKLRKRMYDHGSELGEAMLDRSRLMSMLKGDQKRMDFKDWKDAVLSMANLLNDSAKQGLSKSAGEEAKKALEEYNRLMLDVHEAQAKSVEWAKQFAKKFLSYAGKGAV